MDIHDHFHTVINRLPGLTCWSVQVSGVGSLANLHFGAKLQRDQVMAHPDFQVSTDERVYQGEVVLYLEECPWRLDAADSVLCSWMDDNDPGGRLAAGLAELTDRRVESAALTLPALDLTLTFEGSLTLRVFPDQADPDEGDNYSVTADGATTFVIAARSALYIE